MDTDRHAIKKHALCWVRCHELALAMALLETLPHASLYVVCDRGYASNQFREALWDTDSGMVMPQVACPKCAYRRQHLLEKLWARLKEWSAVATQYEKTATSLMLVICIAAATDRLKI